MAVESPAPAGKRWFQKWWVWALIAFGVLVVIVAIAAPPEESTEAEGATTTTVGGDQTTITDTEASSTTALPTTTSTAAPTTTTTLLPTTTTTLPPTTTTTLPPFVAAGDGTGDDVVLFDIPDYPVTIILSHEGRSNFQVWSLDSDFEQIDLLVNDIGDYVGRRPMQFQLNEDVAGLEITADGRWLYSIEPLAGLEPSTCEFSGTGDNVAIVSNFVGTGGTATLRNDGDSNFIVWAYGDSSDLLVNDIGPYEGTVVVASGLFVWDIQASGDWTVNC